MRLRDRWNSWLNGCFPDLTEYAETLEHPSHAGLRAALAERDREIAVLKETVDYLESLVLR